ncbi:hypothetical protein GOBAR_AA35120 [Gossypium barbadense]|uniref:Uncharacterized protein n=1 Tax=Gossypium barbadense TaxID=3634 RepID=A0A2P5W3E2_GOSBA|nr:hypothetical protein GOBAR_AA35120 [Gossypium barbadense]
MNELRRKNSVHEEAEIVCDVGTRSIASSRKAHFMSQCGSATSQRASLTCRQKNSDVRVRKFVSSRRAVPRHSEGFSTLPGTGRQSNVGDQILYNMRQCARGHTRGLPYLHIITKMYRRAGVEMDQ